MNGIRVDNESIVPVEDDTDEDVVTRRLYAYLMLRLERRMVKEGKIREEDRLCLTRSERRQMRYQSSNQV